MKLKVFSKTFSKSWLSPPYITLLILGYISLPQNSNKTHSSLSMLLLIILFTTPSITAASEWQQVLDKDQIKVYVRDFPESDIKQFKGEMIIDARIDSLVAILSDASSCEKWLYQCVKGMEIDQSSFGERYIYQVNNVHAFANKRDYILRTEVSRNIDNKQITIQLNASPDHCHGKSGLPCDLINKSKYIRVKKLVGTYTLTAYEEQKLQISWIQHIDPGGYLPHFIINSLLKDIPYKSLNNLRKLSTQSPFDKAVMIFDSKGQVLGFNL